MAKICIYSSPLPNPDAKAFGEMVVKEAMKKMYVPKLLRRINKDKGKHPCS